MKRLLIAAIAATALSAVPSKAAAVFSADAAFTSESQVVTEGTQIFGGRVTFNGGSLTLADGVSFLNHMDNATFETSDLDPAISVKMDGSAYGAHSNVSSFSDSALNNVLEGDADGGYGQLFVDGLTTGRTYVIQLFAAMTNSGDIGNGTGGPVATYSGVERVRDLTQGGTTYLSYGQDSAPDNSSGVYAITDTFVATGSEEYLFLDNSSNPNGHVLQDLVQVRDITDVEVPEPSTYAMLGLGALALLVVGKLRRLSA